LFIVLHSLGAVVQLLHLQSFDL